MKVMYVRSNQAFKFIGKQDFHDVKGKLRYIDKGSSCIVQGDVNGDGKADFEIDGHAGSLSKGVFPALTWTRSFGGAKVSHGTERTLLRG